MKTKDLVYMLYYTGLLFLVVAVSLDGFGVGITYGMRKIRVPIIALLIIMLCSGLIVLLSMTIGGMLTNLISPEQASILGGLILIFLGVFSLFNIFRSKLNFLNPKKVTNEDGKRFRIFKSILTKPIKADLDQSGVISANEALLLGAALALDAFGAGIGASMLGYSPIITTLLVAIMSGAFLYSGIKLGLFLSKSNTLQQLTFVPPFLLIVLGVINIF